jgi:hypothetical protein
MASISLTIPDAELARVVDALCGSGHWTAESGVTKNQFAKVELARIVRERVVAYERRLLVEAAAAAAASVLEPQVG